MVGGRTMSFVESVQGWGHVFCRKGSQGHPFVATKQASTSQPG